MTTAFIVIAILLSVLVVICAIIFCLAEAKCAEARDEIDFGLQEFRWPPL